MKPSGIITLTTDFGLKDPYVAMMKGVIFSINPDARIIDVTHQVLPGSISEAAGLILNTFPYFPDGTVHVAVVDPGVGSERRLIALQVKSQFFVGPDNGIFWPVIQLDENPMVIHLTETRYFLPHVTSTFHGRDVFAPVAAHLSIGVGLERMGTVISSPVKLILPAPYDKEGALIGQIARVDHFGNLITNISFESLSLFLGNADPRIEVGKLVLNKLSRTYSETEEGEPLTLINSSGLLEVAVNMGRASAYLGIDQDSIIGTRVKVSKS